MKKVLSTMCIGVLALLCLSCYFGAGKVETDLTSNFSLFANNSLDEMSIWYFPGDHSSNLIVRETVYAVGFNEEFIIAKSHPKDSKNQINKDTTIYHIIEIKKYKKNPKESMGMTKEQYELERQQLNIPDELNFSIVSNELK